MALPQHSGSKARGPGRQVSISWKDIPALLGALALIVAGLWIYRPALRGGWLWDDGSYIFENAIVQSPDGYWKAWINLNSLGKYIPGSYNPLTTLAEWTEWRLWGNETLGYHLVCIALHIASALLLWRLFRRIGLAFAWLGALVFLVHPMMVESVAWISELKNTLALPLLLATMLSWLDYDETGSSESYRSALVWFCLSLAAKTAGLMLPVLLLGHAWWKRGTIGVRDLRITAPFFAISLVAAAITLAPAHLAGAHVVVTPNWTLAGAGASMGWTVLFLVGKCLLPVGLFAIYPGFAILKPTAFDLLPWAVLAGVAFALWLGWRRAAWTRALTLGLGFFLVNLIPVFIYVGKTYPTMVWSMDHLVYLPIIGLIGWTIAWLGDLHPRIAPRFRIVEWTCLGALVLALGWGSRAYAQVFRSADVFWTYLIQHEPQNGQVHNFYANFELGEKHMPEAMEHYRKAIELNPDSDQPRYDLGMAFAQMGDAAAAKENFLAAIRLNPREIRGYLALSQIQRGEGDFQAAEASIEQAHLAAPHDATPLAARAGLLMQLGRRQEGLALYREAVKMTPDVLELRYNYGVALLQAGDLPEAVEQLRAAVDLDEKFAPARENLGAALARTGAIPDAIEQFEAAVEIDPGYLVARENLGLALAQTGHLAEAIAQFQKVLELSPNDSKAKATLSKLQSLQATGGK